MAMKKDTQKKSDGGVITPNLHGLRSPDAVKPPTGAISHKEDYPMSISSPVDGAPSRTARSMSGRKTLGQPTLEGRVRK